MRRVIRILALLSIALSILLCITIVVLWARSYTGTDRAVWTRAWMEGTGARQNVAQLTSKRGRLYLAVGQLQAANPNWSPGVDVYREAQRLRGGAEIRLERSVENSVPASVPYAWLPIRWAKWGYSNPELGVSFGGKDLVVHEWLVAVGLLVGPMWWGRRRMRRWRRMRRGLCLGCGYDLRESPERCPECGAVAVSEAGS